MATLAALIMLSVLLAGAGTGLITRLAGSGGALLERADAPHLAQLHTGSVDVAAIAEFAADHPEITAHQVTPLLGIDGAQLLLDGADQSSSVQQNSLVVPSRQRDLLLDLQDRPVAEVERGTVWLPLLYEDSAAVGSVVTVAAPDGFRLDLEVAGFLRDSAMGPAIAGSKRLAVSAEDLAAVSEHTGTVEHLISFWVLDPSRDLAAVRSAYQEADLPAAGPSVDRSTFMLFTVFAEGLAAALVLLAAAMVLVIVLLTLRLALRTVLARDRREIAVLIALGISTRDVRTLHLLVHGTLAGGAGAVGAVGGVVLERVLSAPLARFLGETGGPSQGIGPALAALLPGAGGRAGGAGLLRRLHRSGPVDVRRGTGGRRSPAGAGGGARPGRLRLRRSPPPGGPGLGLMSLLRRGSSAPLLVTVFAVCTLLVMVPASIATTLSSPQFSTYFGLGAADVRIDLPHTGTDSPARFERAHRTLAEDPRVAEHSALVTTRHLIETAGGEQLGLAVSSGDRSATPGAYIEGRAPAGEGEIALSLLSLSEAGVSVGEKRPIQVRGQWSTREVVGSYQDLTNGGSTARGMLPADGEQVSGYVLGAVLTPGTEVAAVADDLSVQLPGARVVQTEATRSQLLGPLGERVRTAAALASSAAAALAALLAVMISRLWLATDAAALAVQRALGASPLTLRAPYLTRMLLSLLLGLGIGAALSLTAGQGLFNLLIEGMFGGMEHLFQGTSRIDLVIDPLV